MGSVCSPKPFVEKGRVGPGSPQRLVRTFCLVMAAIREREIDRAFDAEAHRELGEEGLLNPDGTLSVEAILASSIPFEEVLRPYPALHQKWIESS